MKRILVVSHCILNTASKVAQNEEDLAEEYRVKKRLLSLVMEKDVQMIQLPCPEFILYGSRRWGHVKDQFLHPHFQKECRKMLEPILVQLEEYMAYPKEYEILGIVSVEGSPSCGYGLTCRGEWGGEVGDKAETDRRRDTLTMEQEPGVLMQILEEELKKRRMELSILSMDEAAEVLQDL